MPSLLSLPVEIVVKILCNLPIPSLHAFQLACRSCNELCREHEAYLYNNLAHFHRLIPFDKASLQEALTPFSSRVKRRICNWKDYCCLQIRIEKGWMGRSPSTITYCHESGDNVHRIKVDEQRGFIVTTNTDGGLSVVDIATNQLLWSLAKTYCIPSAHCEYDNGFLVFNRLDNDKEVWRLAAEFDRDPIPSVAGPDDLQMQASARASAKHTTTTYHHFRPWALLRMDWGTQAFRLSYPTLAVAGWGEYFIWDVRTAMLEQRISEPVDDERAVNYVEVNDRYLFVSHIRTIAVFSRWNGRRVLTIDATQRGGHVVRVNNDLSRKSSCELSPQTLISDEDPSINSLSLFIAVHVSSCGSHLVLLCKERTLVVVRNFEDVISGRVLLQEATLYIILPCRRMNRYLGVYDDRFAAATDSGVFVLTLEPDKHLLAVQRGQMDVPPRFVITRCTSIKEDLSLSHLSCLQMTKSYLAFTVKRRQTGAQSTVLMVNVSPFER